MFGGFGLNLPFWERTENAPAPPFVLTTDRKESKTSTEAYKDSPLLSRQHCRSGKSSFGFTFLCRSLQNSTRKHRQCLLVFWRFLVQEQLSLPFEEGWKGRPLDL